MKIYTRTGDQGSTALFGGERIPKTHARIAAYGTVDETNSIIGLARASLLRRDETAAVDRVLADVQRDLFVLGADLATPEESRAKAPRISSEHVEKLENEIDMLEKDLEPLKQFILPGGSPAGAGLHVARTVCRRAERLVLEAAAKAVVSELAAVYLNRLSDLLFVAARWTNMREGFREDEWNPAP